MQNEEPPESGKALFRGFFIKNVLPAHKEQVVADIHTVTVR